MARDREAELVDLNLEGRYEVIPVLDYHMHLTPLRIAARLLDPDAYTICCALPKTHNVAVVTLSVKNMVLGAPLRNAPGTLPRWSDKRKFHAGIRQFQVNMVLTATKLRPFWGVTVLDGFVGMGAGWPYPAEPAHSGRLHRLHRGGPGDGGGDGNRRILGGSSPLLSSIRIGAV